MSPIFRSFALGLSVVLTSPAALAIPGSGGPVLAVDTPVTVTPEMSAESTEPATPGSQAQPEVADEEALPPTGDEDGRQVQTPCLNYFVSDSDLEPGPESGICADNGETDRRLSIRMGNGFATRSGVLGTFDGLLVDYRLRSGVTLNGIAGRPVVPGQDPSVSGKQVFGFSATTAKFASHWDLNTYIMQQRDQGRTENRAVGGALRYLRSTHSLLVSLDYDMDEDSLSSFMVSGAWKLLPTTTFSATFDARHNYMRTPQANYLKKTMTHTEGWKWALPMDRIKHLAGKRSTQVNALGLGLSHSLSRRIKLSGDFAVLDVWQDAAGNGSTTASSSVNEYFYRLKLSARDLVLSGDDNSLDLRHSVTASSRSSSASLNTRYAINRLWEISPRLRTDYRDNLSDHSVKWMTAPTLKMQYRRRNQYGIEIEAGGKWSGSRHAAQSQVRSSYFLSLGYRAKF